MKFHRVLCRAQAPSMNRVIFNFLYIYFLLLSAKLKQGFEMKVSFSQKALYVLTVNGETLRGSARKILRGRESQRDWGQISLTPSHVSPRASSV